jgi:hypothetical protein
LKPKSLFLWLTTPFLPWLIVDLWIQLNIRDWAEKASPVSLVTRSLIGVDNFVVRYALVVEMVAFLLGPLLAAAIPSVVSLAEAPDDLPLARVQSTVSSLGRWLIMAFLLTGITVPLQMLGPPKAFGFAAFLGWSAFVALVLAMAQMYAFQEYRFRAGRTRWHSRWLVALVTVVNAIFFPVASYLFPTAFYFYGLFEVPRLGPPPEMTTTAS